MDLYNLIIYGTWYISWLAHIYIYMLNIIDLYQVYLIIYKIQAECLFSNAYSQKLIFYTVSTFSVTCENFP